MKKSKFDSLSEKEIIVYFIEKAILSLKEEIRNKQEKNITINGDPYSSENDIMDAYGYGSISRSQMEKAIQMLNASEGNEKKIRKAIDFLQNAYEMVRDGFDDKLERKQQ